MAYLLRKTVSSTTSYGLNAPEELKSDWEEVWRKFLQARELTKEDYVRFPSIFTLAEDEVPEYLPEIYGMSTGPFLVREKVMNEIIKLEPEVHEFLKVNIKSHDLRKDYGSYYYLVLKQKIDAIDESRTIFNFGRASGLEAAKKSKYGLHATWDEEKYPVALHKHLIEGKHLWRGSEATRTSNYFCSDQFHEFCMREKVKGWDFFKCQLQ